MILVYCPQSGPRIRYIFKLIINGLLKEELAFTNSTDEFKAFDGPRINYSKEPAAGDMFFEAEGLLSEKEIERKEIEMIRGSDVPAFFPVKNKRSAMPFDLFAAAFYLVTRYEEYLPFVRDEYGRFQAKDSLAWKEGFLDKPVVNIWAEMLTEKIREKWPRWSAGKKEFRFIPTIDMNAAWMYKRKGFFRTAAGLGEAMAGSRFSEVVARIRVISGNMQDPFDTYAEQLAIHKELNLKTIYFILFADYDNNDRNIPVSNRHFKVLIKSLADYCRIGIHTSFASLKSSEKLNLEFKRLSAVLNKDINMTRQHFHVLNMPVTYRQFVNMDVENDYSMGYAVTPGFRASICDPYQFYDLDFEIETGMKIWPYCIVDKALEYGYGFDSAFRPIIARVKSLNGTLITLWNNESLVKDRQSKVNLGTYEKMIRLILND